MIESHVDATQETARPPVPAPYRLRELELRNFGSHADTRIRFTAPVTFLIGENNHGKTTVIEGLEFAVLGSARGLDGRGTGTESLVRAGTTHLRVTADVADLGQIQREAKDGKRRMRLADHDGTGDLQAVVHERLKANESLIRAILAPDTFLTFAHGDAKALLLGVLDVRVQVGQEMLTLAQLEARYQRAFDDRRRAKKDLADHYVPPRPAEDPPPPLEELDARLTALRQEYQELSADGAEARGRRHVLDAQLETLTTEQRGLERRIEGYGDPHAELDRVERELQAIADVATAAAAAADARAEAKELEDIGARLVDARGRLRTIDLAVQHIKGHSPEKGCVLSADVPCLTPAKEFKGRLSAFDKELRKLQQQISEASSRQTLLQAATDERIAQSAERTRRQRELEEQRRVFQNRARDKQTDETRLVEVLAEIASTQTAIENCDTVQENPQLLELQQRIANGEKKVPAARALAEAWSRYETAKTRATQLSGEVERLEQLVDVLGPKGARVQALESAITSFTASINGALGKFGYSLAFSIEPWQVLVNARLIARLSTSERMRVGLCVQLALSEISGLRLVVVDNTELLVSPAARLTFAEIVMRWAYEGRGQVIVLKAVKADESITPPPGVAVWRVRMDEHGVSSAVCEAEGAAAAAQVS